MDKETIDKVLKIYKRFLKDNGLYTRVMQIHLNEGKKKLNPSEFKDKLYLRLDTPLRMFSDSRIFGNWDYLKEGPYFWWKINVKWKIKCLNENIGFTYRTHHYYDVADIINRFINMYGHNLTDEERNVLIEKRNDFKKR